MIATGAGGEPSRVSVCFLGEGVVAQLSFG